MVRVEVEIGGEVEGEGGVSAYEEVKGHFSFFFAFRI